MTTFALCASVSSFIRALRKGWKRRSIPANRELREQHRKAAGALFPNCMMAPETTPSSGVLVEASTSSSAQPIVSRRTSSSRRPEVSAATEPTVMPSLKLPSANAPPSFGSPPLRRRTTKLRGLGLHFYRVQITRCGARVEEQDFYIHMIEFGISRRYRRGVKVHYTYFGLYTVFARGRCV